MPLGISLNHRPLGLDSRPLFRRLLKLRLAASSRLIEAVRLRPRRPSQTLSELRLVSEIAKERNYGIPCGTLRAPVQAWHLRENELDLKVSRKIRKDLSNGQSSDKGESHGSDLKRRHSGSGI